MQLSGEFIRNAIAGASLAIGLIGGVVTIKVDIATLKTKVEAVEVALSDLKREVADAPVSTVFEAVAR